MIAAPPDIKSGTISMENGCFILTGKPTAHDIEVFEKWRNEIEREERESETE